MARDSQAIGVDVRATRYASVDLLRGASILVMLVLHAIMDTLDVEHYLARLETGAVINILALIVLPMFGGLAGLFLLTSAIGNMLGMTRNLETGHSASAVMWKQVLGGVLIVIFAMFCEAVLGYHGALGQVFLNLHDVGRADFTPMYYRAFNIETLHAIGYAEILNGVTHGLLAKRFNAVTDTVKLIRIYWVLAALVLAVTPVVWGLSSWLIPGYPYATDPLTGQPMFLPVIGTSPWGDLVFYSLLNPLAAPVEPILPYLATSYVGSIIGLQMGRQSQQFDPSFVRRCARIGAVCFVMGAIGLTLLLVNVLREQGFEEMISVYRRIYDHRYYTSQHGMPGGWFWQYLLLSGVTLLLVMLVIRLAEFRGKGAELARRWRFVRRFGFIAFTIYTIQWMYFLMHYLVSMSLGYEPYAKLTWGGTWLVVALSLAALHLLMCIWERFGYIGSIEWAIVSLTNVLSPIKKQVSQSAQAPRWYERGRLDVQGVFYGPYWKSLDSANSIAAERQLIWRLSIAGLLVPPLSLIAYRLTRSFTRDYPGETIAGARFLSIIGVMVCIAILVASGLLSIQDLGIASTKA
jgi:hypothetical protein